MAACVAGSRARSWASATKCGHRRSRLPPWLGRPRRRLPGGRRSSSPSRRGGLRCAGSGQQGRRRRARRAGTRRPLDRARWHAARPSWLPSSGARCRLVLRFGLPALRRWKRRERAIGEGQGTVCRALPDHGRAGRGLHACVAGGPVPEPHVILPSLILPTHQRHPRYINPKHSAGSCAPLHPIRPH